MNMVRRLGLASLVAGATVFSGCQAVEDRVGDVLHGRAFPFNQPAQQQAPQQNNYGGNPQQGSSGRNYNSGEINVNGAFGETYAVSAVKYIGKAGVADIKSDNFINITSEFSPRQNIFIGFKIPRTLTKDVVFRLYDSSGAIQNQTDFLSQVTDAGLVNIITPENPGNYTYIFSGKTYSNSLFGKSIGGETSIVRGQITVK
ncbi:MAG: hypothetical protein Q7R87_00730 [Nanoarchaeota archaeon]|nr:hypothetical protein [Nanoarchaeota archaeon]